MNYIPLNIYTGYTFLSSSLKVEDIISICKKNNFDHIAICDYENMCAFPSLNKECEKNSITPLFGMSFSIHSNLGDFYLVAYIANENGYQNLCKLLANIDSINTSNINDYKDGLIFVLPCKTNKIIYQMIETKDEMLSKIIFSIQKDTLDFYLGIELYSKEDEINMNYIRDFASNHNYKTICFNQHLYEHKNDALTVKILEAIKNDEKLSIKEEETGPFYFLSERAINILYSQEEISNTHKIFDSVDFNFNKKRGTLLKYPYECDSINKKEYILTKCINNLKEKNIFSKNYINRLNQELDIIEKMGYLDYFLIVADYVNWAKNHDIPVGPGRGSAAGALVAYCLGIIDVDPIKYDLIFERFLNPGRVSMPDIDIDIADYRRNDVIEYISNRFGEERMSYIITFSTIGAKQSLRDIGRVFAYNNSDINSMCNACKGVDITLDKARKNNIEFDNMCKDSYFGKIYSLAKKIEGLPRQSSLHAAGIILNDQPLKNIIPTNYTADHKLVCQYEAIYLEDMGFLKMDILGLRNLSIIENITNKIKEINPLFSLRNIPLDDNKTFSLLNKGLTQGVFQLESEGMTSALKQIKINSFDDIVALIALYRPGPMEFIKDYAERKNNHININYIHPSLEEILKPTYGVIIYQEQIMQIVRKVARFSFADADLFRRAISKKDESKLTNLKEKFINGAVSNNYTIQDATNIFNVIYKFANYGFNKSHSVAYAIITYQMAYLKANYTCDFFASLLDYQNLSDNKYSLYSKEFKITNISLSLPNINTSTNKFIAIDNKIIIPLSSIKGLPYNIAESIVYERQQNGNYKDFYDFVERTISYNLTLPHYITLINSGALDLFSLTRETLRKNISLVIEYSKQIKDFQNSPLLTIDESDMFKPILNNYEENENIKLEKELETIGIILSGSLLDKYRSDIQKKNIKLISQVINERNNLTIAVIISKIKIIQTRKKENMAILSCFDDSMEITIVLFKEEYENYKFILQEKKAYSFTGYFKKDSIRGISFIASTIEKLEEKQ